MKKSFSLFLIVFLFLSFFSSFPFSAKAQTYADNTLLRAENDYKIYTVFNGKKRFIKNIDVFNSYGFKWEDIKVVNQAILKDTSDNNLIREKGDVRVYLLNDFGYKRHIPSPEVFNSYNFNWNDIADVSKEEMASYQESLLVKTPDNPKVYYTENNTKRWVESLQSFYTHSFSWNEISTINSNDLNSFQEGAIITPESTIQKPTAVAPTPTPIPILTSFPTSTPTPSPVPTPTTVPISTSAPIPTPAPTPIPVSGGGSATPSTSTPTPTSGPTVTPVPTPTTTPTPAPTPTPASTPAGSSISLSASPSSIPASGTSISVITATIKDSNNNILTTATNPISFSTTAGSLSQSFAIPIDGVTTGVILTSSIFATTATITALSSNLTSGTVQVVFTTPPLSLNNVISVSLAARHTCVLLADKTVKCWGHNYFSQLGNGTNTNSNVPVSVSSINNAISISAGGGGGSGDGDHTCAVLTDGTIKCWGKNQYGQLGNGTNADSNVPVSVLGINNAISVSSGGYHTCAVLSDGTIKCWGQNHEWFGQLGNGTNTDSSISVSVSGINNAISVSSGGYHTCALLADKTIKCWGRNGLFHLLGDGIDREYSNVPIAVLNLANVVSISTGDDFTCVLLNDKTVKCWGDNVDGELGNGTSGAGNYASTPTSVLNLSDVASVSSGENHTCAVLNDKTIKCWGQNTWGNLGDGTNISSNTPVLVSNITNAVSVSTGGQAQTCAVLIDGTVKCWGSNYWGTLGDGTNFNSSVPVLVFSK